MDDPRMQAGWSAQDERARVASERLLGVAVLVLIGGIVAAITVGMFLGYMVGVTTAGTPEKVVILHG